jgi:hypothetical protein
MRRDGHCPYLNDRDPRCGENFSLQHMELAFDHCFGRPSRCPVYRALRAERHGADGSEEPHHGEASRRYVQLTVAGRHAERVAAAA